MQNVLRLFTITLLCAMGTAAFAQEEELGNKADRKRAKISKIEKETLSQLFNEDSKARDLFDKSYGYAVFSNLKIAFGLSGGGGNGVAVRKSDNERVYMKMGTGGIGFGLGGQKYRVVFMFENAEILDRFVSKGWQADTSAHAVAGSKGKNVAATFSQSLAIYVLSEGGLMLQADVSGTKYWRNKKLNK